MTTNVYDRLLDAYEHAFRLAGAFKPTTEGVLYRMLVHESFSDSFLLHIHLRDDSPSTAKLYRLLHIRDTKPDWIMTTLSRMDERLPLSEALPDEVDPNIEERPLTPTQVAWFSNEMARIDHGRLLNCGTATDRDRDGYARRCWICRPGQRDHVFYEYDADEREHPDVFAFARAVYRLGASVMRARFSLDCLVPHQPVLFRGLEARRPLFIPYEHYLREHYVFALVE